MCQLIVVLVEKRWWTCRHIGVVNLRSIMLVILKVLNRIIESVSFLILFHWDPFIFFIQILSIILVEDVVEQIIRVDWDLSLLQVLWLEIEFQRCWSRIVYLVQAIILLRHYEHLMFIWMHRKWTFKGLLNLLCFSFHVNIIIFISIFITINYHLLMIIWLIIPCLF